MNGLAVKKRILKNIGRFSTLAICIATIIYIGSIFNTSQLIASPGENEVALCTESRCRLGKFTSCPSDGEAVLNFETKRFTSSSFNDMSDAQTPVYLNSSPNYGTVKISEAEVVFSDNLEGAKFDFVRVVFDNGSGGEVQVNLDMSSIDVQTCTFLKVSVDYNTSATNTSYSRTESNACVDNTGQLAYSHCINSSDVGNCHSRRENYLVRVPSSYLLKRIIYNFSATPSTGGCNYHVYYLGSAKYVTQVVPTCGNGILDPGEQCEIGGIISGGGTLPVNDCTPSTTPGACQYCQVSTCRVRNKVVGDVGLPLTVTGGLVALGNNITNTTDSAIVLNRDIKYYYPFAGDRYYAETQSYGFSGFNNNLDPAEEVTYDPRYLDIYKHVLGRIGFVRFTESGVN